MPVTFDINVAKVQMTLCAISYVKGTGADATRPDPDDIKAELAKKHYETGGKWSLVWGPAYSQFDDNMMYIAQQTNTSVFSLVIRGTESVDVKSWCEDVPTGLTDISSYTGQTGTLISKEFSEAIDGLTKAVSADAGDQRTLGDVLDDLASDPALRMTVTGHSQGGGLAPVMGAWVANRLGTARGRVAVYAFAPPTPGDAKFASWVKSNLDAFHVANPLDLVPFGYAKTGSVIKDKIPTKVPEFIKVHGFPFPLHLGIDAAAVALKALVEFHSTSWAPAGTSCPLPAEAAPADLDYLKQVEAQHNYNTYLYLLGAPQTDVGTKSPLGGTGAV